MISASARQWMLAAAREAIQSKLESREPKLPPLTDAMLREPRGVFVTLHHGGKLRGCIGTIVPTAPLAESIVDCARSAAFGDPRFPAIEPHELAGLDIELSILTPPSPIDDPRNVEVGRHGIICRGRGPFSGQQGVYLPNVATEHNMSRDDFLSHCCQNKARMPADAWCKPELCEVLTFEAIVVSE